MGTSTTPSPASSRLSRDPGRVGLDRCNFSHPHQIGLRPRELSSFTNTEQQTTYALDSTGTTSSTTSRLCPVGWYRNSDSSAWTVEVDGSERNYFLAPPRKVKKQINFNQLASPSSSNDSSPSRWHFNLISSSYVPHPSRTSSKRNAFKKSRLPLLIYPSKYNFVSAMPSTQGRFWSLPHKKHYHQKPRRRLAKNAITVRYSFLLLSLKKSHGMPSIAVRARERARSNNVYLFTYLPCSVRVQQPQRTQQESTVRDLQPTHLRRKPRINKKD